MKDVFTERIAARRAIVIVGSMLLLVASDMPAQTAEEHASHHRDADEVTHLQETGNRAIEDLATGKTQDIDQVMTQAEMGDMAFKTLLAIPAKLMEAYNEIKNLGL